MVLESFSASHHNESETITIRPGDFSAITPKHDLLIPDTPLGLRILIVGALGHQGHEYANLLGTLGNAISLVDPQFRRFGDKVPHNSYYNIDDALLQNTFNVAIVAVPHHEHYHITRKLLKAGISVIKEKPLASNMNEVNELRALMHETKCPILTISQRRDHPLHIYANKHIKLIGKTYAYSYKYIMNLNIPSSGWRSTRMTARGGVFLDMGYHIYDVVSRIFGIPDEATSFMSYCYSASRREDLEDYVVAQHIHRESGLVGSIQIGRHGSRKEETLEVFGRKGVLRLTPTTCLIEDRNGHAVAHIEWKGANADVVRDHLN